MCFQRMEDGGGRSSDMLWECWKKMGHKSSNSPNYWLWQKAGCPVFLLTPNTALTAAAELFFVSLDSQVCTAMHKHSLSCDISTTLSLNKTWCSFELVINHTRTRWHVVWLLRWLYCGCQNVMNKYITIIFFKKCYSREWTGILAPTMVNACLTLLLYISTLPRCSNGYYGQPMVPGDFCQPCHCHGNLDLAVPDSCDPVTGQCLRCHKGYSGTDCESCAEGYYGDAITAKNCQRK